MNKRIAKKKYKKALEVLKIGRKTGVGVTITTRAFVDKNGKPCNLEDEGSRFITFKRPKIKYIKSENKQGFIDKI